MAYKQPLHLCVVACVSTTTHRQIYRKVDKTLYQQAYADYSANHTQVSRTNRAIVNKQRVPAKMATYNNCWYSCNCFLSRQYAHVTDG